MASIYKRKDGKGWRAVIRIKGYPTVCDHFDRKPEAEDWARVTEHKIKLGQYKFDQHNQLHTFSELLDQYISNGSLEHHRSARDTRRHLSYWQSRLGSYALVHITPEMVAK